MQGKWERQTHRHSCGENYRVGKIIVGSAYYSSTTRGDPLKYAVTIDLPGIKNPDDRYADIEPAKARLERAVAVWFRWIAEEKIADKETS
jgi:hypothetical protein